ncbi:UNVERIFIED_CONTAM: hypothetical protein FKN15_053818 [Acipenser sinensis]
MNDICIDQGGEWDYSLFDELGDLGDAEELLQSLAHESYVYNDAGLDFDIDLVPWDETSSSCTDWEMAAGSLSPTTTINSVPSPSSVDTLSPYSVPEEFSISSQSQLSPVSLYSDTSSSDLKVENKAWRKTATGKSSSNPPKRPIQLKPKISIQPKPVITAVPFAQNIGTIPAKTILIQPLQTVLPVSKQQPVTIQPALPCELKNLPREVFAADPTSPGQTQSSEAICRRSLFRSSSILSHTSGTGPAAFAHKKFSHLTAVGGDQSQCTSHFIEPVQWMEQALLGVMDGQNQIYRKLITDYSLFDELGDLGDAEELLQSLAHESYVYTDAGLDFDIDLVPWDETSSSCTDWEMAAGSLSPTTTINSVPSPSSVDTLSPYSVPEEFSISSQSQLSPVSLYSDTSSSDLKVENKAWRKTATGKSSSNPPKRPIQLKPKISIQPKPVITAVPFAQNIGTIPAKTILIQPLQTVLPVSKQQPVTIQPALPCVLVFISYRITGFSSDVRIMAAVLQNVLPPMVNPIIYCLKTKDIRKSFSKFLQRRKVAGHGLLN